MRPYQIFLLIACGYFLYRILRKYFRLRVNVIETVLGVSFWLSILLLAIAPERAGNIFSRYLGIESDTNAIIFVLIGSQLFIVFKLYNHMRVQDNHITTLTRKLSLIEQEIHEKDDDTLRS